MEKKVFRAFGIFLIIIGIIFSLNSFKITGFTIFENIAQTTSSFIGIILLIGGILFLTAGREEKESKLEIFISNKALERSKKDRFIRQNLAQYRDEIRMITANPQARPQEHVGDFSVSPQGHKNIRVAWHYDRQTKTLYIDDLLYHKKEHEYVDKWNRKATKREITREDYKKAGYQNTGAL